MEQHKITAESTKAELKAALKKWKEENPAPRLEINIEESKIPEPVLLKAKAQLLIFEVVSEEQLKITMLDGNSARSIWLEYSQISKLIQTLFGLRKDMKDYRHWMHLYQDDVARFDLALATWNRQFMAFKDSVMRRLGFHSTENKD